MARTKPAPRRRRTAEEARAAILDAAERRLIAAGPGGIRLQEVAADVEVSHPTVLHHFGSRDELVKAVVERALEAVRAKVLAALAAAVEGDLDGASHSVIEQVSAWLAESGRGRLFFWLALEYQERPQGIVELGPIVEAAHALRRRNAHARGERGAGASLEDTRFLVVLAVLALTAHGVIGPALFESVGLRDDPRTHRRFLRWVAAGLSQRLDGGASERGLPADSE
jgi:AcrR family transcriptional regulator